MARCQLPLGLLSVPVSGHPVSGVARDGGESGRAATGAGLRPALPRRSSSDGEDILGQKGFRATEARKDVISRTFLDLEVASQETEECRSWGTGPYTKMDSVVFFQDLRGFFPLYLFLSSLRFSTNKIATKFKCICLLMEELVNCCSIMSPVEAEKTRMYVYCSLAVNIADCGTYLGLNIK